MRIKNFVKAMNDHGTSPRVKVLERVELGWNIRYEGTPENMDEEVGEMVISSFTAVGKGFIEIYAKRR